MVSATCTRIGTPLDRMEYACQRLPVGRLGSVPAIWWASVGSVAKSSVGCVSVHTPYRVSFCGIGPRSTRLMRPSVHLQNCIVKAPPPSALRGRHRRLCRTCTKAPISEHTHYTPSSQHLPSDESKSATHFLPTHNPSLTNLTVPLPPSQKTSPPSPPPPPPPAL